MMRTKGILWVSAFVLLVAISIRPCEGKDRTHPPRKAPLHNEQARATQLSLKHPITPTAAPTVSETTTPPTPLKVDTSGPLQTMSDSLVQCLEAFDLTMMMEGLVLPLSPASRNVFETIARDSIHDSVLKILGTDQIQGLEVVVTLTSPQARYLLRGTAEWNSSAKHQEVISFDVLILIQSVIEIHDLNRYIVSAFNDSMDKIIFLNTLRASGDPAFVNISTVFVAPGKIGKQTGTPMDEKASMRNDAYLIVAMISILIASGAAIIVVVCFVQYRKQAKRQEQKRQQRIHQNGTFSSSFELNLNRMDDIASQIEVGSFIDISTLGDPTLTSGSGGKISPDVGHAGSGGDCKQCDRNGTDAVKDDACVAVEDASVYSHTQSAPLPSREESIQFDSRSLPLPAKNSVVDDNVGSIESTNKSVSSDSHRNGTDVVKDDVCVLVEDASVYSHAHSAPLPPREESIQFVSGSLPLPAKNPVVDDNIGNIESTNKSVSSDSLFTTLKSKDEYLLLLTGTEVHCDAMSLPLPIKGGIALDNYDEFNSQSSLSLVGSEIYCETSSMSLSAKKGCTSVDSDSDKTYPSLADTGSISITESASSESIKEDDIETNLVMPGFPMICHQVRDHLLEIEDIDPEYWEAYSSDGVIEYYTVTCNIHSDS